MLNAEGQYVLFVCEGVAEQYILTTLIERGELTVPNELIVPNQLRGTWYFTRKESKRMLDRFLNMSYGKHPLLIIRIVDSDSDVLRIPRGYEHAAEVVNLRTHPEIEMLVIINEGMYGKYTNGSKRLKPSDYCKRELGMKQVKSRAWLERYWAASGFREPASCGAPADCQHGAHLVEDASLVLLRCLHVLIPESQGDLSLRRHADPVLRLVT